MSIVSTHATRTIGAPPGVVYECLADYVQHHQRFLPPSFTGYGVEQGGHGEGTVVHFTLEAGGRRREYRMQVSEPEPGRVLKETDTGSSLVTTFTVAPAGDGSQVRIETAWTGAGGVGGFFEKRFAPAAMRRIYEDELARLDTYASAQARGPS